VAQLPSNCLLTRSNKPHQASNFSGKAKKAKRQKAKSMKLQTTNYECGKCDCSAATLATLAMGHASKLFLWWH